MRVVRHWVWPLCLSILPWSCPLFAAQTGHLAGAPHYELVMSADDAVCRPIATLYDDELQAALRKRGARTTDFEATRPEDFARVGFVPSASRDAPADPDLIVRQYRLELFGEAKPRTVVIVDKVGDNYRSSELYILKPGASYRRIAILNDLQPGITDWYIDPAVIADIPEEPQAVTKRYELSAFHGYVLTRWPGFDALYRQSFTPAGRAALPVLDDVLSIRPFSFRGVPYLIENQYARLPLERSHRSLVAVQRLLATGRDDVCYLALNPGA